MRSPIRPACASASTRSADPGSRCSTVASICSSAAAGEGPSGGGYVSEPMGTVEFVFAVAPTHPLAQHAGVLGKSELQAHRAIAVADSARRLAPRTVGLLFGQDTLTVPDMRSKLDFQLRRTRLRLSAARTRRSRRSTPGDSSRSASRSPSRPRPFTSPGAPTRVARRAPGGSQRMRREGMLEMLLHRCIES